MIECLKFIFYFCFWLFLALVMMTLCAIGVYVLVYMIRIMREHHD